MTYGGGFVPGEVAYLENVDSPENQARSKVEGEKLRSVHAQRSVAEEFKGMSFEDFWTARDTAVVNRDKSVKPEAAYVAFYTKAYPDFQAYLDKRLKEDATIEGHEAIVVREWSEGRDLE